MIVGQKIPDDRGRPSGGEFPVGRELGGIDGNAIGMSFDPDMVGNLL